jgi:hypothetical protein
MERYASLGNGMVLADLCQWNFSQLSTVHLSGANKWDLLFKGA